MDFVTCLQEQLRLHPAMEPRDVIKLCYQAARGAEHLLADTSRARAYFDREYAATPADASIPLLEPIGPDVARVNIAAWKAANLPPEWLFRMFVHTASVAPAGEDRLAEYIEAAANVVSASLAANAVSVTPAGTAWRDAVAQWTAAGRPAVHHSEAYRAVEHPAYRIVKRPFGRILPILQRLAADKDIRIIAIDGRAASGKTTKAALLSAVLDAPVIRMDDFFLPPALRTEDRLAQPGGNVHYERFREEVLPHLAAGEAFSCRVFDCRQMDYSGVREISAAPIRIVEGSYAHHPALGDYADLRIFSHVDADEQMTRILRRNGEQLAEMFRTRWIPMEEAYFTAFSIREQADMIL